MERRSPAAPGGGPSVLLVVAPDVTVLPDVQVVLPGLLLLLLEGRVRVALVKDRPLVPLHPGQALLHQLQGDRLVGLRVGQRHPRDRLGPPALDDLAGPGLHRGVQDLAPADQALELRGGLVTKVLLQLGDLDPRELAGEGQGLGGLELQVPLDGGQLLGGHDVPVAKVHVEHLVGLGLVVVALHPGPVDLAVALVLAQHDLPVLVPGRVPGGGLREAEPRHLLEEGVGLVVGLLGVEQAPAHHADAPDLDLLLLVLGPVTRAGLRLRLRLGVRLLVVLPQVDPGVLGPALGQSQRGPARDVVAVDRGQPLGKELLGDVDPLVVPVQQPQLSGEGSHLVDGLHLDLDVPLHAVDPGVLEGLVRVRLVPARAPHVRQSKGEGDRLLRHQELVPVPAQHVVHDGVHPVRPLQEGQELLGLLGGRVHGEVVHPPPAAGLLAPVDALLVLHGPGLRLDHLLEVLGPHVPAAVVLARRQAPGQEDLAHVHRLGRPALPLLVRDRGEAQRAHLLLLLLVPAALLAAAAQRDLPLVLDPRGHLLAHDLLPQDLLGLLGPGLPLVVVAPGGHPRGPEAREMNPPLRPVLEAQQDHGVPAHHLGDDALHLPPGVLRDAGARHVVVPQVRLPGLGRLLGLPLLGRRQRGEHPARPVQHLGQALPEEELRDALALGGVDARVDVAELVELLEAHLAVPAEHEVLHEDLAPHPEGLGALGLLALLLPPLHEGARHPAQEHRGLDELPLLLLAVRRLDQDPQDVGVPHALHDAPVPHPVPQLAPVHEGLGGHAPVAVAHPEDLPPGVLLPLLAAAVLPEGPDPQALVPRGLLRLLQLVRQVGLPVLGPRQASGHLEQGGVVVLGVEHRAELQVLALDHVVHTEHDALAHKSPSQVLPAAPGPGLLVRGPVPPPQPRRHDPAQDQPLLLPQGLAVGWDLLVRAAPARNHHHGVPAAHLLHHAAQPTRRHPSFFFFFFFFSLAFLCLVRLLIDLNSTPPSTLRKRTSERNATRVRALSTRFAVFLQSCLRALLWSKYQRFPVPNPRPCAYRSSFLLPPPLP
mmetsp:Transcript_13767/g.38863  ORF Transcript_13767/g.38863 Transcript_13767/m.38863 type:complete len:1046 (+) Transcript_13767:150-3287(+)